MKTFNEIMKIRDEPDNKPEVTKRKFQVKKTNNEKMQAFGWASVAIAENGETLEDCVYFADTALPPMSNLA